MTDILDLPGWALIARHLDGHEYELEAEYTVQPTACQKCGVVGRLYRHGTKETVYRDSLAEPDHDTELEIAKHLFTNAWDKLNGWEVKCQHCGHEFTIEKVEY